VYSTRRGVLKKAPKPIVETDWGIIKEVREVKSLKASSPIPVTELPIVKEVREVAPKNAR
jgi:hypothetical protein